MNPLPLSEDLLRAAETAIPPLGQKGKYAPLMPAIEILLARKFSLADAMDWLVARNAISAADRRTAYYSISQRLRRAGTPAQRKKVGDRPLDCLPIPTP